MTSLTHGNGSCPLIMVKTRFNTSMDYVAIADGLDYGLTKRYSAT